MKVLELFAGIGGFSVGLERTGSFKTVAFCEIDKHARKVLQKNWPGVPIYEDVKEITYERLKADGNVPDVITGGFPCQDISTAGRGAGLAGERSGLWFEFARIIKEVRPRWVIAENVSALRSRGLDQVLRSLSEIGYDAEWHCIPASAVGAPHQRDRIWIIAYPNEQYGRPKSSVSDSSGRETWNEPSRGGNAQSAEPDPYRVFCWNEFAATEGEKYGAVAYTDNYGSEVRHQECAEPIEQREANNALPRSPFMAYANSTQCEGGGVSGRVLTEDTDLSSGSWWEIEPPVGRVADGFRGRTHRLKQLGNAVVPMIPEIIGRAIIERERNGSR